MSDTIPFNEKAHAETALAVQTACNLSGVVFAFERTMKAMCAAKMTQEERAKHPVTILFVSKLASMVDLDKAFGEAYDAALDASVK